MALIALVNLLLVLFDLSYIPWRDFYLRYLPNLTEWYGAQFKGIEPHRATTAYLAAVQELEKQVAQTGLQSAAVNQQLLKLQELSTEMVNENPFAAVGKAGTLERIKNRMRDHMNIQSAKQAFNAFWSQEYLSQTGWLESMQFFQRKIQPLIVTNYYRGINENGAPIDRFWQIDLWFTALFAAEFLTRTFYLSHRYKRARWLDAMIWRSYDLLLLLPFWRWLRVIPVLIRLDQSKLVNLQPIHHRVVHTLIANVAVELTEMVVVRVIEQIQGLIQQGEVKRWLLQSNQYVDLNGVNEVEEIAKHLTHLLVYDVLPQVQPEVEAILQHSMAQVLNSSPAYTNLQRLPGVSLVSRQLTQQIVSDLSQTSYRVIRTALEDETGMMLVGKLVSRLGTATATGLKQHNSLGEIEALTIALLDEIKVSYVKRLANEDQEKLNAQKKRLYELIQGLPKN